MGITRVGAAGKRGAELCVGTGGKGSRAAVLPLVLGHGRVLALSHAWRPSLGCRRCLWPSSVWGTVTGMWTQWVPFGRGCIGQAGWRAWWFVVPAVSPWPGLLLTSSFGTVSGRASTSVWLMILTNFRRGSIPECGCILPLLRDMV